MDTLLQPPHVVFILLIALILFGPGKLPRLGESLGRSVADLRGQWSNFRGAAFMAKGVDPRVGRDVGDMLPDEHRNRNEVLYLCLLALLIGNTLYFISLGVLPAGVRMDLGSLSGVPALVDLWICLLVFGLLNLLRIKHRHNRAKS
jgi:TatA/E family protein of Tat protein translocase